MVSIRDLLFGVKIKTNTSNVDRIINQINSATEELRKLKNYHDSVVAKQKLNIDSANNIIKQSTEEMNRADAAIDKIKDISQL